ncbi:META domain-containing protein [Jatrophihabitans lederbergiae]|uniref:META domain-containing protein n=1 Tax=Jatrophihabitans lederbergiae TaxID=3075547 RepID=A0ABU2JE73_9ACTN|nr:META domain-containing protein [Jatrophihabitans sp. DSM 44399]MDT0263023.1 META domain-containing protein [Jatrophihabitans sp. DSM 44399]
MSIRLSLAVAVGVLLTTAGCASAAPGALNRSTRPSGSPASASEPPLVGTDWQLASYGNPGSAQRVTVTTDSTADFSAKGNFSAHACNFFGGAVTITSDRISFSRRTSTAMGCGGEPGQLDRQVEATLMRSVSWAITDRVLTLTNPDGHVLVYRVRSSSYPNPRARTILAGNRAGGQYRIAVKGPSNGSSHLSLEFEARTAPGEPWGFGGIASPGPKDCLADEVLGLGSLGGQTFLGGWATPEVAKVTTQATAGSPETALKFYAVPGSSLRIVGVWTSSFVPSKSPVTFYDNHGKVIAAYPHGPASRCAGRSG